MEEKVVTNEKKFADGLCFKKIFLIFVIFSFIGCLYEDLLFICKGYINEGIINYSTKRGLLYFELSPIYGWGACIMVYLLSIKEYKKYQYFLFGSLIGGTFEYLISFLQETFTGTTSWDYSTYLLNINGRTTIPYMLFWGLLCYILMVYIYPFISNKIESLPYNIGNKIYYILLVLITIDMFLSFSACIRMGLRHEGYKPLTGYGEFLDKVYNDERMKKSYTNMVVR